MNFTESKTTIEISTEIYHDEDGSVTLYPKIRAYSGGFSLGMLALDSFDDLFTLRDNIDKFIIKHKTTTEMSKDSKDDGIAPAYVDVIRGYLESQGYRPYLGDDKPSRVISSKEIILALVEMVDLELNDVADSMLWMQYGTGAQEGKIGWVVYEY